jgi:predicted DNA-binding antitoxin AbrB/MazE fold protein
MHSNSKLLNVEQLNGEYQTRQYSHRRFESSCRNGTGRGKAGHYSPNGPGKYGWSSLIIKEYFLMNEVIAGIYRNGVVEPVEPLEIPEDSQVLITILPGKVREPEVLKFQQLLLKSGLVSKIPVSSSMIQNHKRRRIAVTGKSLSETIIEERI